MAEPGDYEYELAKRHKLEYKYMMACKKCLQLEEADVCDSEALKNAIKARIYIKDIYEMQDTLVKFCLYENKAFIEAQRNFRNNLANFLETTF